MIMISVVIVIMLTYSINHNNSQRLLSTCARCHLLRSLEYVGEEDAMLCQCILPFRPRVSKLRPWAKSAHCLLL